MNKKSTNKSFGKSYKNSKFFLVDLPFLQHSGGGVISSEFARKEKDSAATAALFQNSYREAGGTDHKF